MFGTMIEKLSRKRNVRVSVIVFCMQNTEDTQLILMIERILGIFYAFLLQILSEQSKTLVLFKSNHVSSFIMFFHTSFKETTTSFCIKT